MNDHDIYEYAQSKEQECVEKTIFPINCFVNMV